MRAPHHSIFTGRLLFLMPNQQRQCTGGKLSTFWRESKTFLLQPSFDWLTNIHLWVYLNTMWLRERSLQCFNVKCSLFLPTTTTTMRSCLHTCSFDVRRRIIGSNLQQVTKHDPVIADVQGMSEVVLRGADQPCVQTSSMWSTGVWHRRWPQTNTGLGWWPTDDSSTVLVTGLQQLLYTPRTHSQCCDRAS